jgi:hypothetical protein
MCLLILSLGIGDCLLPPHIHNGLDRDVELVLYYENGFEASLIVGPGQTDSLNRRGSKGPRLVRIEARIDGEMIGELGVQDLMREERFIVLDDGIKPATR